MGRIDYRVSYHQPPPLTSIVTAVRGVTPTFPCTLSAGGEESVQHHVLSIAGGVVSEDPVDRR